MKPATNMLAGRVVEFFRRPDLLDAAETEDHDAVPHRHRFHLVVGDVDRGRAQHALQADDLAAHLDAQLGVQVAQRLVHQEDARVADDGAAQRHALPLAAGELARPAVQQALDVQHRRDFMHALVDFRLGHAAPPERVTDVAADFVVRVKGVILEHHGDVAMPRRHVVHQFVVDANLARRDRLQPGDHA